MNKRLAGVTPQLLGSPAEAKKGQTLECKMTINTIEIDDDAVRAIFLLLSNVNDEMIEKSQLNTAERNAFKDAYYKLMNINMLNDEKILKGANKSCLD